MHWAFGLSRFKLPFLLSHEQRSLLHTEMRFGSNLRPVGAAGSLVGQGKSRPRIRGSKKAASQTARPRKGVGSCWAERLDWRSKQQQRTKLGAGITRCLPSSFVLLSTTHALVWARRTVARACPLLSGRFREGSRGRRVTGSPVTPHSLTHSVGHYCVRVLMVPVAVAVTATATATVI